MWNPRPRGWGMQAPYGQGFMGRGGGPFQRLQGMGWGAGPMFQQFPGGGRMPGPGMYGPQSFVDDDLGRHGGGDDDDDEGGPGGPEGGGPPTPMLHPQMVVNWLDHQHPLIIKNMFEHCKFLLGQHGVPLDQSDQPANSGPGASDDWFAEQPSHMNEQFGYNDPQGNKKAKPNKKRKGLGFGIEGGGGDAGGGGGDAPAEEEEQPGEKYAAIPPPNNYRKPQMQWTPGGWRAKDNTHKITTTMKRLPAARIVPQQSQTYPDAGADWNKLNMLENNANMMKIELQKICKRNGINPLPTPESDMETYPAHIRDRLKMALTCSNGAEKSLNDFKTFLKNDKYKEYNEKTSAEYDEKVKQMIGEEPQGVPHKEKAEEVRKETQEMMETQAYKAHQEKEAAEKAAEEAKKAPGPVPPAKPSNMFTKGGSLKSTEK